MHDPQRSRNAGEHAGDGVELASRHRKKVSEREEREQRNFLEGVWLFMPLVKNEAHGQTVGQRTGEEVVGAELHALG